MSNPHALYLIQQGEFVASLPMGQGTYTWPDGNTYDGEVCNCLRHGIGTYKSSKNSVVYTGQWGLGKRHGTVRFTHVRQVYVSACFSSVLNAGSHILQPGTDVLVQGGLGEEQEGRVGSEAVCTGLFSRLYLYLTHLKVALIYHSYPSGNIYSGEWRNNLRHGEGTMRWMNLRQQYVGMWQDGVQVLQKTRASFIPLLSQITPRPVDFCPV